MRIKQSNHSLRSLVSKPDKLGQQRMSSMSLQDIHTRKSVVPVNDKKSTVRA
jgi:hypothetical protein